MHARISWITGCGKCIPSRTDFAILEMLAASEGFVSRLAIIRMTLPSASAVAKSNSLVILQDKGLIERRENDRNPLVRITSKGRQILELCQKTSVMFSEIEDSFEKGGW